MSIRRPFSGLALPVAILVASATAVGAQPRPAAPAAPTPAAPAPAFEAGQPVVDSTGRQVGTVQSLVETPAGPMVVARIDGKLISLPQRTLKVEGDRVVSSQSKAQMVAAAGAPPG